MDRQGAVAGVRRAVDEFARTYCAADERWCVALSGGADSLALTAVAAASRPTTALIVDHGLQPDSQRIADGAREQALELGCVAARIIRVRVGTSGGPEGAARA
ncbi:MAG: ATP-binding protein, partial [Mycobacterium sp.]